MNFGDTLARFAEAGRPWLHHYGLWAVGIGLFAETFLVTGFFVPGYGILIATGYLIAQGVLKPLPVLLIAWSAAIFGDQVSYVLGLYWGPWFFRRRLRFLERLRKVLEHEGPWLLLAYHYSSTLRTSVPSAAGCSRYSRWRWLIWDSIGVLIWVTAMVYVGVGANGVLKSQGNVAALVIHGFPGLVLVCVFVRLWVRLKRYDKPEAEDVEVGCGVE